jgi:hypothetical protein
MVPRAIAIGMAMINPITIATKHMMDVTKRMANINTL